MNDVTQQQIDNIEEQVALAEKGYQGFRRMFAQTNARPEKRPYKSRLGILRIALMIIMVAGSIVSASHTMPTFMGDSATILSLAVGLAAFFMSEVALAAFAYVGVMRHYRETQKEPESLKALVSYGVVVPFVVMAAANISHEFKLNNVILPDIIRTLIILAISLSAPFMSYISGEVFAMFEVIDRVDQEKHDADYAQKLDAWEEKCRATWSREKVNYGGKIRIEPVPMASIPFSNGNSNGMNGTNSVGTLQVIPSASSIGHKKQPQASQKTRKYFEQHESELLAADATGAIREGVAGHSTVYKVMAQMRKERGL